MDIVKKHFKVTADRLGAFNRPFIGSALVNGSSTQKIPVVDPYTGKVVAQITSCSPATVANAARSAARVFDCGHWANQPVNDRRQVLMRLADMIMENAELLALADTSNMGKPIKESLQDVAVAAAFFRYNAEALDKIYDEVAPSCTRSTELLMHKPRGVVAAITPWNYPVINAALKSAPALAVGNSVILKPSEFAPQSAIILAQLAIEAGLPENTLSVVTGGANVGAALVADPNVSMVTFTGSTHTGGLVASAVAQAGPRPHLLELGGKSPQIIFADFGDDQLDALADRLVSEGVTNSGQLCVARTRLLIQDTLYDQVVEKVAARLALVRPGDPMSSATDFGPLANARQFDVVQSYIDLAENEGLEICGGPAPMPSQGLFIMPRLYGNVPKTSRLFREEIFGPILTATPFKDETEAVQLANATDLGLAASVWTRDIGRAYRLAHAIKAGDIRINASTKRMAGSGLAHSMEPHSSSGFGIEGGLKGLRSYTKLHSVTFTF